MSSSSSDRPGIAGFALYHAKAIIVVVLGLCLWGTVALFVLPAGIYPDVAFPRIVVIAERGEESVENMMIGVTRPLEEAVNAVLGLVRVRSKTIRGATEMSLDFGPGTDMREAVAQTRARVAALLPTLPAGVTTTVEQQTPSVFPVLSFNVSLDAARAGERVRDGADLLQWAQLEVKPRLSRIPDVFLVTVQGAESRALLVEPDPRRLAAAKLSLDDLSKAVAASNRVEALGVLERNYLQFQLLGACEPRSLDEIAALPVAVRAGQTVRLRDVAGVRAGLADRTAVVTGDGRNAVVVSLFMRYGGKVTDLSDRAAAAVRELGAAAPPGVAITTVNDQAQLVHESLGGVRDAIVIGMILAVAVLWIFLGSWRLTAVAGLSIPISVLGTFACLQGLGESLNLMSLGGIAVAIGLIIDDAIVVVENIARGLRPDRTRAAAVVAATREVVGAVVGSSLTTVVVFIPLVLLEGVVGQFFKAMAVALAVGILVSLAVSLTLTPILSAGRLGPWPGDRMTRAWMERLSGFYERTARRALASPRWAALALAAVVAAGVLPALHQETGFLPAMDERGFVLDYRMPIGTSLGETDRNCRQVEAILHDTPEIRSFSRRTGAELGFFVTEQNTGDFLVGFKSRAEAPRPGAAVIDGLRQRIAREVPQLEVSFVQVMQDTINDLAGNPSPLEVKVFGADYHVIQDLAGKVERRLDAVPGLVDVQSGIAFGNPELTYRIDPEAAARAGLTVTGVQDQLRTAFVGESATLLRRGERLVPVVVRYPDAIRRDPTWLPQLPLADAAGRPIPAALLTRLEEKRNVNELARENQQPLVSIRANLSGRDLGSAAADVRGLLARIPRPPGVRIELGGQVESKDRAFQNLLLVLALALGLVFLLLVIQFRSYRLTLIIFLTLPFSQLGGLLALLVTDTELNLSAFMGLIMLVGLVVKNGIILIEYTAQLRRAGVAPLAEALVRAGRVRLRPILMTSLTAVTALLPLALNLGAGAELQRPLAIAVIGGLSVSTLFTLLVVPVAHLLLGEPEGVQAAPTEATAS